MWWACACVPVCSVCRHVLYCIQCQNICTVCEQGLVSNFFPFHISGLSRPTLDPWQSSKLSLVWRCREGVGGVCVPVCVPVCVREAGGVWLSGWELLLYPPSKSLYSDLPQVSQVWLNLFHLHWLLFSFLIFFSLPLPLSHTRTAHTSESVRTTLSEAHQAPKNTTTCLMNLHAFCEVKSAPTVWNHLTHSVFALLNLAASWLQPSSFSFE